MNDSPQDVNFNEMEKEIKALASGDANKNLDNDDIQFEETLNIEELQKKLFEKIENEQKGITSPEDEEDEPVNPLELFEEDKKEIVPTAQKPKINKNAKKYVIYVDSENIEFMDGLSQNARKDLINKILSEQNENVLKARRFQERKQYVTHVLLACITFVIFFPILFMIVNKSTEATIQNYNEARQNFGKLYKKQGKIKPKGAETEIPSEY